MDQLFWIISLIPDWFLEASIHASLIAGVVLTVIGNFASKFPFIGGYAKLAKLLGPVFLVVGIFFEGALLNEMRWRAQVEALKEKIKVAETQSTETNVKIKTVVKEKIKVVKPSSSCSARTYQRS